MRSTCRVTPVFSRIELSWEPTRDRRRRQVYLVFEDGRLPPEQRSEFALDSPLEEGGFEPLVPLQNRQNRGTGPMSPTASIRVAY
jgi:hypothetical protein